MKPDAIAIHLANHLIQGDIPALDELDQEGWRKRKIPGTPAAFLIIAGEKKYRVEVVVTESIS